MNKKIVTTLGVISIALSVATAFAAVKPALTHGGLGQIAGDTQNFGVAVCNSGTKAVAQAASLSVNANGRTVTVNSAAPINAGACTYTYLSYAQFGMEQGRTYPVAVTIDGNTGGQATYSLAVPTTSQAAAVKAAAAQATADVNVQSGNFFSMIANWFSGLFGGR